MNSDRYVPVPVGFARVNKEPLDKYETFDNLYELIEYVYGDKYDKFHSTPSKPIYNGQLIKLKDQPNIMYKLIGGNNQLRISPIYKPPIEETVISVKNGDLANILGLGVLNNNSSIGDKYLLVYYKDCSIDKSVFSYAWQCFSAEAFNFSLLNNIELYRNSNKKFNMLFFNSSYNSLNVVHINQYTNPVSGENYISGTTDNSTYLLLKDSAINYATSLHVNNVLQRYGILPTKSISNDDNSITALFICVDDYYSI